MLTVRRVERCGHEWHALCLRILHFLDHTLTTDDLNILNTYSEKRVTVQNERCVEGRTGDVVFERHTFVMVSQRLVGIRIALRKATSRCSQHMSRVQDRSMYLANGMEPLCCVNSWRTFSAKTLNETCTKGRSRSGLTMKFLAQWITQ